MLTKIVYANNQLVYLRTRDLAQGFGAGTLSKQAICRHAVDVAAAGEHAGSFGFAVVKERGECCEGGVVEEKEEEQAWESTRGRGHFKTKKLNFPQKSEEFE
jgi:hypothetical protein